jgi:hypothetical protein
MTYNGLGYDFVATSNCDAALASRQAKGAVEIKRLFVVSVFKVSNSFRF